MAWAEQHTQHDALWAAVVCLQALVIEEREQQQAAMQRCVGVLTPGHSTPGTGGCSMGYWHLAILHSSCVCVVISWWWVISCCRAIAGAAAGCASQPATPIKLFATTCCSMALVALWRRLTQQQEWRGLHSPCGKACGIRAVCVHNRPAVMWALPVSKQQPVTCSGCQ